VVLVIANQFISLVIKNKNLKQTEAWTFKTKQ